MKLFSIANSNPIRSTTYHFHSPCFMGVLLVKSFLVVYAILILIIVHSAQADPSNNHLRRMDNDNHFENGTVIKETETYQDTRRTSFRSFLNNRMDPGTSTVNNSAIADTTCIGDDSGLRKAVLAASTNLDPSKPATKITVCSRVKISTTKDPKKYNVTGIDISGKNIDLKCFNPTGLRCVLDGQRSSRILYGYGAVLRATNIDFINAFVPSGETPSNYFWIEGSALAFKSANSNKSRITLIRCSFRNNRNEKLQGGGAIYTYNSFLTLSGTSTSLTVFSGNYASYGSAIYLYRTKFVVQTGYVIFSNNTADGSSAVQLYQSETSLQGVTFVGNRGEDAAALRIESGKNTTLQNVNFVNNSASGYYGAVLISNTKADFKTVTFNGNSALEFGGLVTRDAVVNLDNCTFWNNKVKQNDGADIHILDNDVPTIGGSFVSCKNTVFCNGVGKKQILDYPLTKNTNCIEKGIVNACRA